MLVLCRLSSSNLPGTGLSLPKYDTRLDSKQYLYVLLHELLHKALPECTEDGIIRISELLSKGVWQQGFRRLKE